MKKRAVAFMWLAVSCGAEDGSTSSSSSSSSGGAASNIVTVQGRSTEVHLPAGYDEGVPAPLLVMLHAPDAPAPLSPEEVATDTIRGQYAGYADSPEVAPGSQTATFAAIKLSIDNWRWQGVPFHVRAGKCLPLTCTEVLVRLPARYLSVICYPQG